MLCIRGQATACLFIKVKNCQMYTHWHFSALKTTLAMSLKNLGVLLTFLRDAFSFHCREKKSTRKLLITEEKPFREINRQLETKKLSHLSSWRDIIQSRASKRHTHFLNSKLNWQYYLAQGWSELSQTCFILFIFESSG